MKTNLKQRKVKIIAEVHPQFMGSMNELERMIIQCKANGADYIKLQLYNSKKLFNNNDREYLEFNKNKNDIDDLLPKMSSIRRQQIRYGKETKSKVTETEDVEKFIDIPPRDRY